MENVVDSLCLICDEPLDWLTGTPRWHRGCYRPDCDLVSGEPLQVDAACQTLDEVASRNSSSSPSTVRAQMVVEGNSDR